MKENLLLPYYLYANMTCIGQVLENSSCRRQVVSNESTSQPTEDNLLWKGFAHQLLPIYCKLGKTKKRSSHASQNKYRAVVHRLALNPTKLPGINCQNCYHWWKLPSAECVNETGSCYSQFRSYVVQSVRLHGLNLSQVPGLHYQIKFEQARLNINGTAMAMFVVESSQHVLDFQQMST